MQMYVNSEHKRGQELMDEQKFDKALLAFNKALEMNPNHPDILSHRGVLYLHLGQKKKCLDDLELSLNLDKDYAYRYACLAVAKENFGDLDAAIELYEKAVEIDPQDAINQNNLGLLIEKKGYQAKANKHFESADKLAKIQSGLFEEMDTVENERKDAEQKTEKRYNPLPKPGTMKIPSGEPLQPKKLEPEANPTFKQVSKDLMTKKSVFKEFVAFVKNGFKLDKNDA